MNKELLFAELKESIKRTKSILIENGNFAILEDQISIGVYSPATNKVYFAGYIKEEFNKKHIDLRNRRKLAVEFINTYNFADLQNEYFAEEEEKETNYNKAQEEVPKLENLKNEIDKVLSPYYRRSPEISYYKNYSKHVLEFNCIKDKYHNDGWRITTAQDDKFEILHTDVKTILNMNEVIEYVSKDVNIYKAYKEEVEKANNIKQLELEKQYKISNFVYGLEIPKNKVVIFKNKSSYFAFTGGLRYAVGTGKSGKYIKCSRAKLEDMILNKDIREYIVAEDRSYSTEELKAMNYNKIA